MDFTVDNSSIEDVALSYDDTETYEDQVNAANSLLASRISKSRVYLLADSVPRAAKVRRHREHT